MQRLVTDKYPDIISYGCNAHLFNLLGVKFTDQDLQDKVTFVQKFMKYHHFTSAEIEISGAKRPIIPGTTRWNSQLDCFSNYQHNHAKYLGIIRKMKTPSSQDDKNKLARVKSILDDPKVYEDIESTLKTLKPIAVCLDIVRNLMVF